MSSHTTVNLTTTMGKSEGFLFFYSIPELVEIIYFHGNQLEMIQFL